MLWKSLVNGLLVSSLVSAAVPAFAFEASTRDAELKSAIEKLAERRVATMSWKEYGAYDASLDHWLIGALGLSGGAAALVLKYTKNAQFHQFFEGTTVDLAKLDRNLEASRGMVTKYGKRAGLTTLAVFLTAKLLSHLWSAYDEQDVDSYRVEAAKHPDVYRSALTQFFRLSKTEQFLTAKRDKQFADDLIALSKSLDEADAILK